MVSFLFVQFINNLSLASEAYLLNFLSYYLQKRQTSCFDRPGESWMQNIHVFPTLLNFRFFRFFFSVYSRSVDFSNLTSMANRYPNFYTYDGSVLKSWHGRLSIDDDSNNAPRSAWCAKNNDTNNNQFLQLDLKVTKVIQAIAVQSHSSEDKWVKSFTISSSLDGLFWKQYTDAGNLKVSLMSVILIMVA